MEKEIWKPIKGFEGAYEVSNMGRIASLSRKIKVISRHGTPYLKTVNYRILSPGNSRGYMYIRLGKKGTHRSIHRIVATAFIPNENNLPQVNHINMNKADNRAVNLEWCSAKQNMDHMRKNKTIKYHTRAIVGRAGRTVIKFDSVSSVKDAGFNRSAVQNVLAGLSKTHAGYTWEYNTRPCHSKKTHKKK